MEVYITTLYLKDSEIDDKYLTKEEKLGFAKKVIDKGETSFYIRICPKTKDPVRSDNIFSKTANLETLGHWKRVKEDIFDQYSFYLKHGLESYYSETRRRMFNGAF